MASRANHLVLLGCGLLCAAALLCAQWSAPARPKRRLSGTDRLRSRHSQPGGGIEFPDRVRRPPGRRRQADPLHPRSRQAGPVSRLCPGRPLSCGPRSSPGQFPACRRSRRRGAGAGQGVPLRSRHAGRIADRVRPDRTGQDRQILCAGGGQRPAAAAGARIRRGRSHRLCPVAGARKPSRTAARDRRGQRRRCHGRMRQPRRSRRPSRRTRGRWS